MTPLDWAIRPLIKYADFSGRAPRAEYWWFVLASAVFGGVLAVVDRSLGRPILADYGVLRLTLTVALLLPSYAVTVRRLHDTDTTGWWVLARLSTNLFLLVPILHLDSSIFDQLSGWFIAALIVLGLGWVCAEISLLVFLVIPGTRGSNRYGSDPYGPNELEEVFA